VNERKSERNSKIMREKESETRKERKKVTAREKNEEV